LRFLAGVQVDTYFMFYFHPSASLAIFLQGGTKITINLCDDGMLQLPQFVS